MTVVKMCGLTRREDVDAAVAAGATALGFVMWPGSPRAVAPVTVAAITTGVPSHVMKVGVFVDAPLEEVAQAVTAAGLTAIQLHGREDVREYLALGVQVIKAVAPRSDADVHVAIALPGVVTVLVDAHDPVQRGGTGRSANWTLAAQIATARPILLAGGLSASNVAAAINSVKPWGIDVSSGIESSPGIKDPVRIQDLMANIHPSAQSPIHPPAHPPIRSSAHLERDCSVEHGAAWRRVRICAEVADAFELEPRAWCDVSE